MQKQLQVTQRQCCCPQTSEQKLQHARKGLPLLKRRRGRRSQVTTAFVGAAEPFVQAGVGLTMSSGLVSLLSFALGGFGLAYLLSEQAKQPGVGPNPECGSCEGTGLVPCICNRWSDGDSGCSICRSTGRMTCPSCGGGGTAVPIAATLTPARPRDLMADQRR